MGPRLPFLGLCTQMLRRQDHAKRGGKALGSIAWRDGGGEDDLSGLELLPGLFGDTCGDAGPFFRHLCISFPLRHGHGLGRRAYLLLGGDPRIQFGYVWLQRIPKTTHNPRLWQECQLAQRAAQRVQDVQASILDGFHTFLKCVSPEGEAFPLHDLVRGEQQSVVQRSGGLQESSVVPTDPPVLVGFSGIDEGQDRGIGWRQMYQHAATTKKPRKHIL
mmetsp:Transcript_16641/g.63283  ORF Transcript_16641/g.63283 Transcript_16641/m.63283 type:complete len:218 (-) Transcript_16641:1278-1931(-)